MLNGIQPTYSIKKIQLNVRGGYIMKKTIDIEKN